ncbi:hypothetical protein [Actinomycetospora flava]|uniref:DUF4190 domain-containing protein n=1 Tax=Actinomycetospora flava TaxID=3129232 RepID=A0ABU8LXL3_9PSEU
MALSGAIVSLVPVVTGLSFVLCPVGLALSLIGLRLAAGRRTGHTLAWVGVFAAVIGLLVGTSTTVSRVSASAPAPSAPTFTPPTYSYPSYTYPSYSYPSYTPTPTAPATTAPVTPRTYRGSGDDVVSVSNQPGAYVLEFSCPRCSGNTVLRSDGSERLLVNTIGSYEGKRWIDIRDGSVTTQLEVEATGSWTITIGGLDRATQANGQVSGEGDDVVMMSGNSSVASVTNRGSGNFVVHVLSGTRSRIDLAVNEIGSYNGTVSLDTPALVQVTSEGNWSITPR